MSTPSPELRVQIKNRIRELLILGDSRQSIIKKMGEEYPDVAPSTIDTYQKHVRKGMSISESEKTRRIATSRGILRQRLEYLYHICVSPDKGKPDQKVALEALKMMMALDGLGGPATKRPDSAKKEKFVGSRVEELTDDQLREIAEGGSEGRISKEDVDDMDVEVQ